MLRYLLPSLLFASMATAQEPRPFAAYHSASEPVLNDPHDLTFGPDGNLYIADKFGNRVVLMDPDTLQVIGSIGDGALAGAHDVSFGPDGLLYVAATGLSGVVIYDLSDGPPRNLGMLGPFPRTEGALAHSNGRLYVMASGTGNLFAIEDDTAVAVASGMFGAHDVAEAPDGSIWVADNAQRRLVQFNEDLEQLAVISGPQFGFIGPRYMDILPDGTLVVADQDAHRVLQINPVTKQVLGIIGSGSPGNGPNLLDDPEGVAIRGAEFFFADSDNNRIVKYVVALN